MKFFAKVSFYSQKVESQKSKEPKLQIYSTQAHKRPTEAIPDQTEAFSENTEANPDDTEVRREDTEPLSENTEALSDEAEALSEALFCFQRLAIIGRDLVLGFFVFF